MSEPASEEVESSRFLVSVHHPAQAHFYRHIVSELLSRGHVVHICARDKEVTAELLEAFGLPHTVLCGDRSSLPGLALTQSLYELRLLREAVRFQPDVMTSIGGLEISHIAPLVEAKSLAFDDTAAMPGRLLTLPTLDVVCTPAGFRRSVKGDQRSYAGYHELAYLHPDRFEPNPNRLRVYGVDPDERYFVVRFAGWQASHDIGEHGLGRQAKLRLIMRLLKRGTVYISSEEPLPPALAEYRLEVPPHRIHDLLRYADLYVGDSGTMATEAAVLGTPAIRSNSAVGADDYWNFLELEKTYELMYSFSNADAMLSKLETLLDRQDLSSTWKRRRRQLLADKIDVTSYAIDQLEQLAQLEQFRETDLSVHATNDRPNSQSN